jgi:hypothetical protein
MSKAVARMTHARREKQTTEYIRNKGYPRAMGERVAQRDLSPQIARDKPQRSTHQSTSGSNHASASSHQNYFRSPNTPLSSAA